MFGRLLESFLLNITTTLYKGGVCLKKNQAFSKLPSVDKILSNGKIEALMDCYPRKLILESIREEINRKREEIIFLDEKDIDLFDIKEDDLDRKSVV